MEASGQGQGQGQGAATSRRGFLEAVGAGASASVGAGVLAASGSGISAWASESARGYRENDTVTIGCLGTGGRCSALMKALTGLPNVKVAALCDIYPPHRERVRAMADPKALLFDDFRRVLDLKDIDAVLIAAPDHWHVPMTIAACEAGKDVYVEKPLTHTLAEAKTVVDAQNTHRRIVQVGTQQRSMPHFQKGRELVAAGKLGKVFKVHLTWNRNTTSRFQPNVDGVKLEPKVWKQFLGNAPDQPFDAYKFRNWRWFWDFGGGLLTDLMVHFLDVAQWYLDFELPEQATAMGDHFAAKGVWETPDTIQCFLKYPKTIQVYYEGTFSNARNAAMIEFMGTDGTLYLDRGRYEFHPERNQGKYEEMVLTRNPKRGQDFYENPDGETLHLSNWLDCVKTRKRPNAPADVAVLSAAAAQLANLAYRENRVVLTKDEMSK